MPVAGKVPHCQRRQPGRRWLRHQRGQGLNRCLLPAHQSEHPGLLRKAQEALLPVL